MNNDNGNMNNDSINNINAKPPIEIIQNHPCYRHRTKNVEFSSTYIPPSTGLQSSCEIPFGYIITPFSIASTEDISTINYDMNTEEDQPITCVSCLGYFNIYCEVMNQGSIWICPLCNYHNAIPINSYNLLGSCMSSPLLEYRTKINQRVNTTGYILIIDENLSNLEIKNIRDTYYNHITNNNEFLSNTNQTIIFSLITFSSSISIYQIGLSGIASSNVYKPIMNNNNNNTNTEQQFQNDIKERSFIGYNIDGCHNLYQCLTALCSSNDTNITTDSKEDTDTTNNNGSKGITLSRKEYLLQKLKPKSKSKKQFMENKKKKHKYRCTGTAIKFASDLATSISSSSNNDIKEDRNNNSSLIQNYRILLFTNGCPNLGIGTIIKPQQRSNSNSIKNTDKVDPIYQSIATQYYTNISKELFIANNIGIDIFISNNQNSSSSILGISSVFLPLVSPSSGYVIQHSTLDDNSFVKDFIHVLKYTYLSYGSYKTTTAIMDDEENVNTNERGSYDASIRRGGFDEDEEGGYAADYNNNDDSNINEFTFNGCLMDIRLPSFMEATQIIGPGKEITLQYDNLESESSSFFDPSTPLLPCDISSFTSSYTRASNIGILQAQQTSQEQTLPDISILSTTLQRIQIGRYDPLSTFSSILKVGGTGHEHNEILPENAIFQYVIRYISKDGNTYITRVYTYKLNVASTIQEFVKNVDDEIMPVLLGREAILRCFINKGGTDNDNTIDYNTDMEDILSTNARNDLDVTIHRISTTYRKLASSSEHQNNNSESNNYQSSQDFAFPPELSTSLHLLHHLRRGPLLNTALYNIEDRSTLRSLYLRLPLQDCLMIMAPNLWSVRLYPNNNTSLLAQQQKHQQPSSYELIAIPPETLVLWDNVIIASDHYDSLFIWSGQAVTSSEYDIVREQCTRHLQIISEHRFPQPEKRMYALYDGDSMSRHFTCRLVPTHLDPPEYQVAHFPDLTYLSTQDMMSLRGKFRFFGDDGSSDSGGGTTTFRKWFWSVASVSSKINGTSLCA